MSYELVTRRAYRVRPLVWASAGLGALSVSGSLKTGGEAYLKSDPTTRAELDCYNRVKGGLNEGSFTECAKIAATQGATAYCKAQGASGEAAEICGKVGGYIAGKVAPLVYKAGDKLVTGVVHLFGGGDEDEGSGCLCEWCFRGRCFASLPYDHQINLCSRWETNKAPYVDPAIRGPGGAGKPVNVPEVFRRYHCADLLSAEAAARVTVVTTVDTAYRTWLLSVADILNTKLNPELRKLGKNPATATPADVEQRIKKYVVPAAPTYTSAFNMTAGVTQRASWIIQATAGALAGTPTNASKTLLPYGWFTGSQWNSPVNAAAVGGDQFAAQRASAWAYRLHAIQPLLMADIIREITVASTTASHAQQTRFLMMQQNQQSAMLATGLILAAAAATAVIFYNRRKR